MSPFIAYDLKMFEKKNLSGRSNKVYHPDLLCSFEHWMTLLLTNIELWEFIHRNRNNLIFLSTCTFCELQLLLSYIIHIHGYIEHQSIIWKWVDQSDWCTQKKIKTWECINYCLPIALLQNMLTMAGLRILGSSVSTQQSLAWVSTFSGDIVNWE